MLEIFLYADRQWTLGNDDSAPPVNPCMRRITSNSDSDVVNTAINEAITYIEIMSNAIFLRPYASDNGPNVNCPIASPIIANDSVSCTCEVVVPKSLCTFGSEGTYISIVKGPKVVIIPNIIMTINGSWRFVILSI